MKKIFLKYSVAFHLFLLIQDMVLETFERWLSTCEYDNCEKKIVPSLFFFPQRLKREKIDHKRSYIEMLIIYILQFSRTY